LVSKNEFPDSFVWGVASSAYQTEGTKHSPTPCESIWDRFTITNGKTPPENGCDIFNHVDEDISFLKNLGINSYRFSLSWCRLQPERSSNLSEKALDLYKKYIDKLNENNITPYVTLYHWDLPQRFQDKGGWENRDTGKYFSEYSEKLSAKLSDRISNFITLNELYCVAYYGHLRGLHAPGNKLSYEKYLQVIQNLLFAHGMSVHAIRSRTGSNSNIGISLNANAPIPKNDSIENIEACSRRWNHTNGLIGDLLFKGEYPNEETLDEFIKNHGLNETELKLINSEIDFLGMNVYQKIKVENSPKNINGFFEDYYPAPGTAPVNNLGWPIHEDSLEFSLSSYIERYFKDKPDFKIMITENGVSYDDQIKNKNDQSVDDQNRIDFLQTQLNSLKNALEKYPQVKGYFLWTLLDNYEWGEGYKGKFGLIETDRKTLCRKPKKSYYWYQNFLNP
jgi:beta-glucosidase